MPPNQDIASVLRAQEYYRLKQVVQSPGDIYELDESAKAVYIGPDSDLAEVQLTYFNPDEPLALETATVSVNGPFVGRVDSLPKTMVPSTGQPARILVSPVDIVNNAYVRPGAPALRSYNIQAQIDLIVALKSLPTIPAVRADRTFRLPRVPFNNIAAGPGLGSTDIIIPIYGRRLITVQVLGTDVGLGFFYVALEPGQNSPARTVGTGIISPAASPRQQAFVIRGSQDVNNWASSGTINAVAASLTTIQNPIFNETGMADLLVINVISGGASPVVGLRYVDLFIKLSDRET